MSEWQPIATAPNDRRILVFCGKNLQQEVCVYCSDISQYVIAAFNGDDEVIDYCVCSPTHWQELPPSPKAH